MFSLKNLKHITIVFMVLSISFFGMLRLFGADFLLPITHFFVYREGGWQDIIYKYHWKPSTDAITLIKITDTSLNTLQAGGNLKMLTIPKSTYLELVEKLERAGVKGIAFDIVFQNADPDEDAFATVLKKYKNVVIASTYERGTVCKKDADGKYETCDGVPRSVYSDAHWGMVNLDATGDRRVMRYDISDTTYASWKTPSTLDTLALALYSSNPPTSTSGTLFGDRPTILLGDDVGGAHRESSQTNHLFEIGKTYLTPFFGGPDTYPSVDFSDVLTMPLGELIQNFSGKYVFIGESGTLIHDAHTSPVSGTQMDGVETHAHLLDGLIQGHIPQSVAKGWFFLGCLLVGLGATFLYLFLPSIASPFLAVFLTLFVVWISRFLYGGSLLVLDVGPLLFMVSIFSFPLTFIYRFFVIDTEKRELQKNFSHYVDPNVVKKISEKGGEIFLGGESRELSVLFSDIAGFTTISEKLDPKDLFSLMSGYLSRMTDILIQNGGTLDKYIGDAVMGFFGAPLPEPDHAIRSCRTALAMRTVLPGFNQELIAHGLSPIDFRVGIASGEVLVGNIGSHDRFNYTVLGDTVNLASRLEATSKEYATRVIIAEPTYLAVKEHFFCRKLDCIAVKGKTLGVAIYELVADIRDTDIDHKKYEIYEQALELYRQEKYLEAGKIWESNMADDKTSEIMALRCVAILKGEVKVEGGVYHMTHK